MEANAESTHLQVTMRGLLDPLHRTSVTALPQCADQPSNCCSSFPRMPSSYQVGLWKQESFVVLRSLRNEFFRSLLERARAMFAASRSMPAIRSMPFEYTRPVAAGDSILGKHSPVPIHHANGGLSSTDVNGHKHCFPPRDTVSRPQGIAGGIDEVPPASRIPSVPCEIPGERGESDGRVTISQPSGP